MLKLVRAREDDWAERTGTSVDAFSAEPVPANANGGLGTLPPRENGGNMDTPELTIGSRAYFPVSEKGALFSLGDIHYSQGGGEVCGSAIEIGATVTVQLEMLECVRFQRPGTPGK
jgi:formamidase